jgi:hypothetical protein
MTKGAVGMLKLPWDLVLGLNTGRIDSGRSPTHTVRMVESARRGMMGWSFSSKLTITQATNSNGLQDECKKKYRGRQC